MPTVGGAHADAERHALGDCDSDSSPDAADADGTAHADAAGAGWLPIGDLSLVSAG